MKYNLYKIVFSSYNFYYWFYCSQNMSYKRQRKPLIFYGLEIKITVTCKISKAAPFTTSIIGRTSMPFGDSNFFLRAFPPSTYNGQWIGKYDILKWKKQQLSRSTECDDRTMIQFLFFKWILKQSEARSKQLRIYNIYNFTFWKSNN